MSEADDLQRVKSQLDLSRRRSLQRATILGVGAAALPLFAACSNTYTHRRRPAPQRRPPQRRSVGRPQRRSLGRPQRRSLGRPQRRSLGRPQRRSLGRPSAAPSGRASDPASSTRGSSSRRHRTHLGNWTATSGVPVEPEPDPERRLRPGHPDQAPGRGHARRLLQLHVQLGQVRRPGLGARSQGFPGRRRHAQRHVPPGPRRLRDAGRRDRERALLLRGRTCSTTTRSTWRTTGHRRPQSLQEQSRPAKTLKAAGIAAPYVAYWIKEFCEEYLMVYLLGEGITAVRRRGRAGVRGRPEDGRPSSSGGRRCSRRADHPDDAHRRPDQARDPDGHRRRLVLRPPPLLPQDHPRPRGRAGEGRTSTSTTGSRAPPATRSRWARSSRWAPRPRVPTSTTPGT